MQTVKAYLETEDIECNDRQCDKRAVEQVEVLDGVEYLCDEHASQHKKRVARWHWKKNRYKRELWIGNSYYGDLVLSVTREHRNTPVFREPTPASRERLMHLINHKLPPPHVTIMRKGPSLLWKIKGRIR